MHLFTLIGALAVLLCGIEGARILNQRSEREVFLIDSYISLVRYITVQIDCFAMPIGEILKSCDEDLLRVCGASKEDGVTDLLTLFSHCELSDKDARSVLFDFCSGFGKSYLGEQLKRCEVCVSMLEKRKEELNKELPKKKKLNFTLCVSGALCVIIVLI